MVPADMPTRYRAQISRTGSPQTYTGVAIVADLMAPTYEVEIDGKPGRTYTLPRHLVALGAIEGTVPTPPPARQWTLQRDGKRRWHAEYTQVGN